MILTLLADLVFFSAAYFYNKFLFPAWYIGLIPFAIITISSWIFVKMHIAKKLLLIIASFIIGVVSGYILLFSTMLLPGSKEHNHVMYYVCLPALKNYYKSQGTTFSLDEKGWKEHEQCERNVWNGKEPLEGIR